MSSQRRTYQVGEVAALSGLSIRALRHYDAIGLLCLSARTAAGYRLYGDDDLLRLQQILIGRELGLSLEDIRRSLDEPGFDRRRVLREQRAALAARAARAEEMIRAIDAALTAVEEITRAEGITMSMQGIFEGFDPARYAVEAEQRWGDTEAYRVSQRRTEAYTAADWRQLQGEQAAIYAEAFAALSAGVPPEDVRAMDVAEEHRLAIDRWFYPCSAALHRGLADLWEADPRFAAAIDRHGPGLTRYLAAAVRANAARGGPSAHR